MTPDDLAAIRALHGRVLHETGAFYVCHLDGQDWPCHTALALAEVDRLTARWESASVGYIRDTERARIRAAVEGMDFVVPRLCSCHAGEMRRAQEPDEYRAAVLAAIDGEAT